MEATQDKTIPSVALASMLLLLGTAAHGGVHVDRDRTVEVGTYATYAVYESEPDLATSDPVAHAGVLEILRGTLDRMGLDEVESDPDCWIVYHAIEKRHGVVSASRLAGADGAAPNADGRRVRATEIGVLTVSEYAVGTLIVDVLDGSLRKLIWRGSVSGVVTPGDATLGDRQLDKMVRRVIRKWEAEYRRQRR